MAIAELVRARVDRVLRDYCVTRVPGRARHQVRLEHLWRGDSVTLVERRAPWSPDAGPEWSTLPIAQLRYASRKWRLFWQRANGRWVPYEGVAPSPDFARVLGAIDRDSYGVFWG